MRSRNLFLKPRSSLYGRWWILALLLAGLYLLFRSPNGPSRDDFPWQPPIEPNGVMIRESAAIQASASTAMSATALPKEQSTASEPAPQAAPTVPVAEASSPPLAPTAADAQVQVRQAIEQWSRAWSARDVNAYLEMYARSFVPDGGQGRSAWEQTRRQRILSKTAIAHEVRNLQISLQGNQAVARFEQTYTADHMRTVGAKTLRLELESGKWRIVSESTS